MKNLLKVEMGLEIPFEKAQVLKGHDSEVNSLPSYFNFLFPDSFFLFMFPAFHSFIYKGQIVKSG